MVITSFNPEVTDLEKSYLSNPYSVGAVTIVVKNSNRFVANDRIMLGGMGQEKTEVVTVSNVAADGVTLTVGATLFSHEADTPVYKLRFDQVKFYRSSTGESGAYSVISTQDLDVDNANLTTIYDDTTGVASYYYKISYYHSLALLESSLSDPIPGPGYLRTQVGAIINEILQEVSDQNEVHITRAEVLGYFNDVNDDLTVNVGKPYSFLHTRSALSRPASQSYIDFPTDAYGRVTMWKFDRMDYNFTDPTVNPATDITTTIQVIPMEEFRNTYSDNTVSTTTTSDATPEAMALDTSVNRFRFSAPFTTALGNVFYLHYWKFFDVINSEGDGIETPTPKIYKLYSKGMYYRKRAVTESTYNATADRYFADYQIEKNKYKQIDRLDRGTARGFRPQTRVTKTYQR